MCILVSFQSKNLNKQNLAVTLSSINRRLNYTSQMEQGNIYEDEVIGGVDEDEEVDERWRCCRGVVRDKWDRFSVETKYVKRATVVIPS